MSKDKAIIAAPEPIKTPEFLGKRIVSWNLPKGVETEVAQVFHGNEKKFVEFPKGYKLRLASLMQGGDGVYPISDGIAGGQTLDIPNSGREFIPLAEINAVNLFNVLGYLGRLDKAKAKFDEEQGRRAAYMKAIEGNPDRKRAYDYYKRQNRKFVVPLVGEWRKIG